ncbi:response regulator [Actinomyces provencensis]|uniref:response regulator n=1 Tax=Actinomyces provencensis TaxID=1720198 RepID=UPI00096AADAD|nr:response regulator transcription factor [Actinomyces provencensis]
MDPLRLLLADDDPALRESLASLLGSREDIDLVDSVPDGAAALGVLEERCVDVALLDVDMPVLDGIDTTRRIVARHPDVTVVMLTSFAQDDFLDRALAAGANGFLTKDLPIASLARLLHAAVAGETVMGPRPTAMLAESYRSRVIQREEDPEFVAAIDALPTQLREVLGLLTRAASNRTIAKTLGLREKTAQAYVSDILRRTGCQSRAEVAVRALAIGAGPVRHTG